MPAFQMPLDELLETAGGVAVDLALHRDSAIAAAAPQESGAPWAT
jgi:hypothetical protein